jgi:hypothetical protein
MLEELYIMASRLRALTVAAKAVFYKSNYGDGSREWLNLRDELEVIDANLHRMPELTRVGYKPNE